MRPQDLLQLQLGRRPLSEVEVQVGQMDPAVGFLRQPRDPGLVQSPGCRNVPLGQHELAQPGVQGRQQGRELRARPAAVAIDRGLIGLPGQGGPSAVLVAAAQHPPALEGFRRVRPGPQSVGQPDQKQDGRGRRQGPQHVPTMVPSAQPAPELVGPAAGGDRQPGQQRQAEPGVDEEQHQGGRIGQDRPGNEKSRPGRVIPPAQTQKPQGQHRRPPQPDPPAEQGRAVPPEGEVLLVGTLAGPDQQPELAGGELQRLPGPVRPEGKPLAQEIPVGRQRGHGPAALAGRQGGRIRKLPLPIAGAPGKKAVCPSPYGLLPM